VVTEARKRRSTFGDLDRASRTLFRAGRDGGPLGATSTTSRQPRRRAALDARSGRCRSSSAVHSMPRIGDYPVPATDLDGSLAASFSGRRGRSMARYSRQGISGTPSLPPLLLHRSPPPMLSFFFCRSLPYRRLLARAQHPEQRWTIRERLRTVAPLPLRCLRVTRPPAITRSAARQSAVSSRTPAIYSERARAATTLAHLELGPRLATPAISRRRASPTTADFPTMAQAGPRHP